MDRCRCEEYTSAVDNLKYYTLGTLRPDIIENHDRSGFGVKWVKQGVSRDDLKFLKPKAFKIRKQVAEDPKTIERRKIEQMWCPYLKIIRRQ
ncbi:hypothetical protein RR48_02908 [Papilio machaon]|uniref:Uncharacterized protein n=1 Tax=Papilio machaon TaxID=76193 RepID=A0A0N1I5F4_PAPMA|nr:hypothetical protein RR48_02908 [Papilio machaon]